MAPQQKYWENRSEQWGCGEMSGKIEKEKSQGDKISTTQDWLVIATGGGDWKGERQRKITLSSQSGHGADCMRRSQGSVAGTWAALHSGLLDEQFGGWIRGACEQMPLSHDALKRGSEQVLDCLCGDANGRNYFCILCVYEYVSWDQREVKREKDFCRHFIAICAIHLTLNIRRHDNRSWPAAGPQELCVADVTRACVSV